MSEQLHHTNSKFQTQQFPIVLICDQVNSPANIGSLFRIADSFGIEKIYFCGEDITVVSKRMLRTARSTHQYIDHEQVDDINEVLIKLQKDAYTLLALEITAQSIPVSNYEITANQKIALIIGEENLGVSEDILQMVAQEVHIPMYGNNSSMNVATATGIALYALSEKLKN